MYCGVVARTGSAKPTDDKAIPTVNSETGSGILAAFAVVVLTICFNEFVYSSTIFVCQWKPRELWHSINNLSFSHRFLIK